MGVDATLFIIADYSCETSLYASAMIALNRNRDLWPLLEALPVVEHAARIQVMQGSWTCYSDGTKPADQDDRELGYKFGDSYAPDGGFKVYRVADLGPVRDAAGDTNRAILDFVLSAYPGHRFLVIWH